MPGLDLQRHDDGIAVLRLDRPERRNALDTATLVALLDALAALAGDDRVRVLVVSTTSTRALSAGADIDEALTPAAGVERMELFARVYAAVEAFPAPTIAVCVGHCVGAGAELAAGCDLRVGGDNVRFAWVGGQHGVPVGPARLVPLVGLAHAKDLVLTGRRIGLAEAEALGLVQRSAAAGEAEATALALAAEIAGRPAAGLRVLKGLFRDFEGTADRVARENDALVAFQREGAGLPRR